MQAAGHKNQLDVEGPELTSVSTDPKFALGQRALHVRAPGGNILWDCISLVDDRSVNAIQALGGVPAIAISHPHYYAAMIDWSRALGDVPVYLHAADGEWVMRPIRHRVLAGRDPRAGAGADPDPLRGPLSR